MPLLIFGVFEEVLAGFSRNVELSCLEEEHLLEFIVFQGFAGI